MIKALEKIKTFVNYKTLCFKNFLNRGRIEILDQTELIVLYFTLCKSKVQGDRKSAEKRDDLISTFFIF